MQTCRGSHTHTLVRPKNDPNNVYIYVSGTAARRAAATELAGCDGRPGDQRRTRRSGGSRSSRSRSPHPSAAAIVNEPRLFAERGDRRASTACRTRRRRRCTRARARPRLRASRHRARRAAELVADPITDACHDITVYEKLDLAAGACEGNGLLIDISDPANPKRIDAVADPLFAYWHGATFSNDGKAVLFTDEWGGGTGARCRATDQLSWGADAIYEIVNRKLVFRSYYKLPVAQTTAENCVSHVGNLSRSRAATSWSRPGTRAARRWSTSPTRRNAEGDRLLRPRPGQRGARSSSGGFWSTYWYNGAIYGSEIARGFDSFKLTPTRAT